MKKTFTTYSAEETRDLGKKLAQEIAPGIVLCLQGNLGAGKTTFAQGLLEGLGAERPYVSPTFVIMKQYDLARSSATGIERIYHADAYRVGAKDFEEIGFAEWCADPQGLVLLEWPERVKGLIPPSATRATFSWKSDTEREIVLQQGF